MDLECTSGGLISSIGSDIICKRRGAMGEARLAGVQAQDCQCRPDGDCQFADICPRDATRVCRPKGTSIALPGIKPTRVYLVHEGVVGMFRAWPSGEETIISLWTPGSLFGALSLLEERELPRPALFPGHLRTLTPSCICELNPESFLSHICSDPQAARVVVTLLVKELRQTYRISMLPARRGAERALAWVLALLAEKAGE